VAIYSGDDRRRLVPLAICAALRALIQDEALDPSARRAELRTLLYRVQRVFNLEREVNESDLAQALAEEDGHAHED